MLSLAFRGTPVTEAHRQAHTYNLLPFYYATLTLSIYSKIITYLSNRAMFLHAKLTSCDKAIAAIREKKKYAQPHKLMLILNHMQTAR